ncbi:MAG: acyl-CoA dehydrogenase C-terminal domain-containing protein [Pseudomonadota bacterium]|nr:acyl-CoA dehydrogenase C-terminal domain-containing protein [Pseudomonadota bacterium]
MPVYKAPLRDIRFVLHEVFGTEGLVALPGYGDFAPDLLDQILEEGARLAENELQPLNLPGDTEGCVYENGVVRTPKGFREAYENFCRGGWAALSCDPQYGGQGLPQVINFILQEIISSANLSFGMYPGLSHGAYNALHLHGADDLKKRYLPKLVDGTWSGTMCLTEPQCGTDLGLVRTKAEPAGDGSHKITGTKIFISAGEHDLTENIIHLVLARLPDAPEGTRGISLFIVPKFLPEEDGTPGARNGVRCASIEHKMGIRASSTCVMNFDGATGWLVGEPHKGMKAMFTMMNAARLGVGMQGLGLAEVSAQNAVAYARERLQGRSVTGVKAPDKPADPLIVHPDVRKNLLTMRAFNEGARALSIHIGMMLDVAERHPDSDARQEADDLVALMTPVIKAYFTDMGFEGANRALQLHGGYGYIHEYGMEQFVRDARITQIYEGANAIQALDLVGRKMGQNYGRLLRRFFHPLTRDIEKAMEDPRTAEFAALLAKAFGRLQQATVTIAQKGLKNADEAAAASADYLRMFGLVALGHMWLLMTLKASEKLSAGGEDGAFYETKLKTGRFFFTKMLPEVGSLFQSLMAGAEPLMAMEAEAF